MTAAIPLRRAAAAAVWPRGQLQPCLFADAASIARSVSATALSIAPADSRPHHESMIHDTVALATPDRRSNTP